MPRIPRKKVDEIIELTNAGWSLNKISRLVKLNKTTTYYYFLKTRGRTFEPPLIRFENDFEKGEVVGIFAGDGSFSFTPGRCQYLTRIHLGNERYAQYVKDLYARSFGKKFTITREGNRRIVQTTSKPIAEFFKKELSFESERKAPTVGLKTVKHSQKFLKGFLRGLIDTDGTVNKRGRITFYTTSKKLARQVNRLLKKLGFENKMHLGKLRENANYPLFQVVLTYNASSEFNKKVCLHKPFS